MSETKHTPGPWRMEEDAHAVIVFDSTDNTIAEFTVDTESDVEFNLDVESGVRAIRIEETRANAALFIAAPDLQAKITALEQRNRVTQNVACDACQILDVIKQEWGEAWSEWDQSVRDKLGELAK